MLFAPAEQYPYDWWALRTTNMWHLHARLQYENSLECFHMQWIGEMEIFKHEGGLEAYKRYRELIDKITHPSPPWWTKE